MYNDLKNIILRKKYIIVMTFSLLLALIGMIVMLYEPQLLGNIIDSISQKEKNSIQYYIFLYVTFLISGNVAINTCKYLINRINAHIIIDLRNNFFSKLVYAKIISIENISSGDLISKFETDISVIANFLTGNIVDFFINIFSILIIMIYIVTIDVIPSLIIIFFIPLEIAIVIKIGNLAKKNTVNLRKLNSNYLSYFEKVISGIKDLKSYNKEDLAINSMDKKLNLQFSLINKISLLNISKQTINKIFLIIINIIIILYFYPKVIANIFTIGVLIAFLNYTGKFYSAIFGLSGIYTNWKTTEVSIKRVNTLFNLPQEVRTNYTNFTINDIIKVDNISFSYNNEIPVFKDFYLILKPNTVNIITGKSGIGKTTLCELLIKLYQTQNGQIYFGKTSIEKIDYINLRDKIAYISQKPSFFDETLYDNIFDNSSDKNKKIDKLVYLLQAFDLISLKDKIFENINLNLLSMGQRQRVNIIRGLLKEADIYFFDEPTSSIDTTNKIKVLKEIAYMLKNKTVVIITHDDDVINFFHNANIINICNQSGKEN